MPKVMAANIEVATPSGIFSQPITANLISTARRLGRPSGALRAALFAQRHPEMVARLALDAMVWTGEGSPTLAERRKRLPEFLTKNRRPIDRAFVHSIFSRDHYHARAI